MQDTCTKAQKRCQFLWVVVLFFSFFYLPQVYANDELPTGGTVTAGTATISTSGQTMNIDQTTPRAIIDWKTIHVGEPNTLNFNQPDVHSVTLNRTLQDNPSRMFGKINATGKVFFFNPNGFIFGQGVK
jgi:filamentous hemagglutinin family protein